jgi:cyclohexadienyl dehydratase
LHQIIQKKEIRVGTSGDYPPFSYLNPQTNQYEGMDITLAHKLGGPLEAKVTFVRFKWPELNADLMADKFDIAMGGIGRNVARGKIFAYPIPMHDLEPVRRQGKEMRENIPTLQPLINPG